MRLLHTSTLTLTEFIAEPFPPYAILSHRWDAEELTFQDLKSGLLPLAERSGYSKVAKCCAQAAEDGWQYAWIDSCCIDKTSSTELSEAINSMFQWYENGQVCYAYLSDVSDAEANHYAYNSAFRKSKWWTRGWTLQELLAPKTLVFFSRDWVDIGTKSSLGPLISAVTGVKDLRNFGNACVAAKMSWAARRKTTRVEDKAYCLLGLFGVHIPLLYGEGNNAFIRLQLEILKASDDESIFAWEDRDNSQTERGGLLATSVTAFKYSGDLKRTEGDRARPPFAMTNKALRMEPLLIIPRFEKGVVINKGVPPHPPRPKARSSSPELPHNSYLMPLNCGRESWREDSSLAIWIRHHGDGQCSRDSAEVSEYHPIEYLMIDYVLHRRLIYVRDRPARIIHSYEFELYKLSICTRSLLQYGISVSQRHTQGSRLNQGWDEDDKNGPQATLGVRNFAALMFTDNELSTFVVVFQVTVDEAWMDVLRANKNDSLKDIAKTVVNFTSRGRCLDRISKLLESGVSVSVALKKRIESGTTQYRIEISIDSEGRLRWPRRHAY